MNFSFVTPDLERLMQDLVDAPVRVGPAVRAAVTRGALNVKRDAAARFEAQRRGAYLPAYSASITYDVAAVGDTVEAEVGPDVDKVQGPFGPGIEFGSVNHAPMPHLIPALDAEEPKLLRALGDAAVRAIG